MATVKLANVQKSYPTPRGSLPVLLIRELELTTGSFYCLSGPSGSGKTTLMNVIAGLTRPDSGSVIVDGIELTLLGEAERDVFRAKHIGMVFQAFHLLPALTALENVMMPAFLAGLHNMQQRAEDLLNAVGLAGRLYHRPDELSRGEQQRAAIARALLNSPKLILADEPTGNLDAASADTTLECLVDVSKRAGATVLIVSHSNQPLKYCQEIRLVDINQSKEVAI